MTTHTMFMENGTITYNTVDAEFQFEGETTYMEVHRYCGPSFYTLDGDDMEVFLEADDSERYNPLWDVYETWADNKALGEDDSVNT